MYIEEDELNELRAIEGMHQDDVAMFIDNAETLEELASDLKDYFKLDENYYKERQEFAELVRRAMAD